MPTYIKSAILSSVFAACLASTPTIHAQDFPPPNATVRAMAPIKHYEGVPDDIRDVTKKALELGVINQRQYDRDMWNYENRPPNSQGLLGYAEGLRERLHNHLYPTRHPWIEARENKTGWWRHQDETDAYLGPEMATWCEPEAEDCTPPVAVSVLCDAAQVITCRTIAQAVRLSDALFLLDPYSSTPSQIMAIPDVTLVYGQFPGAGQDHVLYAIRQTAATDAGITLDYNGPLRNSGARMGQPADIVSMIYDNPEEMLQRIHSLLDIKAQ